MDGSGAQAASVRRPLPTKIWFRNDRDVRVGQRRACLLTGCCCLVPGRHNVSAAIPWRARLGCVGRTAAGRRERKALTHTYAEWVEVASSGLYGGSSLKLAQHLGWKYQLRDGRHWMRPATKPGQPERHLQAHRLADAGNAHKPGAYSRLVSLPSSDRPRLPKARIDKLLRELRSAGTVPSAVAAFELAVATAAADELPRTARDAFPELLKTLPEASMWLVQVDPVLLHRLTALKAFVAVTREPDFVARTAASPADGGLIFQSASGQLHSLLLGGSALIRPALNIAAPYVIGSCTPREYGLVVVLFGRAEQGREGAVPSTLLQMAGAGDFAGKYEPGGPGPSVAQAGIEAWFRWYISALDGLLTQLFDPRCYADAQGRHQPVAHLALVLTVERLFASVVNLLTETGVNDYKAKLLAFSALDCLESLPGHSGRTELLRPSRVAAAVDLVLAAVPKEAAPLLARLERAPDDIAGIAEGFFEADRRRPGQISLLQSNGKRAWVTEDLAVGQYQNLIRNGTHGYRDFAADPRESDLLLAHSGELPRAVADGPVAHVLKLLTDPVSGLGRHIPEAPAAG